MHKHAIAYPLLHPQPGYAELDPEVVCTAVKQCIQIVCARFSTDPKFISFSAAMHGLIAMDKSGKPLTHCITWADTRATTAATQLRSHANAQTLYENTGVPIHAMTPLCKLIWLQEMQPAVFKQAAVFIGIKEYVLYQLTGHYVMDTAMASATGLLNIHTLKWDEQALALAGISPDQLPPLVGTHHILSLTPDTIPDCFQLPVPLVVGSSDGALSNMGILSIQPHCLSLTIGTSAAARILVTGVHTDVEMRSFCYHASANQYIIGGASNNGAVVLQWLKESILQTEDSYDALLVEAFAINPGSDGLLLLPYLLGERAPVWNASAKAVFFGLQAHHTRAHLTRAVVEAISYNLYSIAQVLQRQYPITEIRVSGGVVQSREWLQLLADLFQLPVCDVNGMDSTPLGAVLLGIEALQLPAFNLKNDLISEKYVPNPLLKAPYQQGFEKFQRLYERLKEEM